MDGRQNDEWRKEESRGLGLMGCAGVLLNVATVWFRRCVAHQRDGLDLEGLWR